MVVTLGHELQHALEVAGASQVVSQATFAAFYARIGQAHRPGRCETRAARQVALRIRAELSRLRRGAEGVGGHVIYDVGSHPRASGQVRPLRVQTFTNLSQSR
jgi:hypothetical protein